MINDLFIIFFFFFNDTATTEIYTLSLHDALPISKPFGEHRPRQGAVGDLDGRSEEHTSELQSRQYLVCRLLLEKKKKKRNNKEQNKKKTQKQKTKNTEPTN